MSTSGIIFANLHEQNIPEMTKLRSLASVPFGCRYRLIDFALSNMVNSGISEVRVITRGNYQSLMDHLGSGKDWDLARRSGGLKVLPPYVREEDHNYAVPNTRLESMLGVRNSVEYIDTDYTVLADCDHICNIDLRKIIRFHKETEAKITFVAKEMELNDVYLNNTTVLEIDENNNLCGLQHHPRHCKGKMLVSLNLMICDTDYLKASLDKAKENGYSSFMNDTVRNSIGIEKMNVYTVDCEFEVIRSIEEYFNCSMRLLNDRKFSNELFNTPNHPILTKVRNSAPTKHTESANVKNSLIADGCIIEGNVENSILFRGVRVEKGAVVKNSILFQDVVIGKDANINYVIADKKVNIREERIIAGCLELPIYIQKGKNV